MGFPCLVLWDFKTDGWPPVPIPKPSPRPRAPWIELRLALAMLRQWFDGLSAGPCLVLWDFKTDGWPPAPIPKAVPAPNRTLDWAAAGFSHAAAMVWWAFGWHPVWFYGISHPIPKPSPLAMLRQWFDGISAVSLSSFMGFQNWRMAPCPDPKALPAPKRTLDWAAAGFSMVSAGALSGFMGFQNWPMASPPRAQELLGLSCGWL